MKMKTVSIQKTLWLALSSLVAVALAVGLPQVCHVIGRWTGLGTGLGEMLLPMHLPVMLVGFVAGPVAGVATGLISPLLSYALTGMPVAAMVPFMMVELAVYGLCAGLLSRASMPGTVKVLLTQVAGRMARALALVVAAYGFGLTTPPVTIIWTSVVTGLAGILIQLLLIPQVMRVVKR